MSFKFVKNIISAINCLIVIGVLIAIFKGTFNSDRILAFFAGLSLVSALVIFNPSKSPGLRLVAAIGLLIMLIHPFGSAEGIRTVAIYSFWICFPISIDLISQIKPFNIRLQEREDTTKQLFFADFSLRFLRDAKLAILFLIIVACIYNVINFPYLCDRHRRTEMLYSVNNKYMRGIFTTQRRAGAIDELLAASKNYIQPNDIVLAYDCMPLYHYMTETRPYVRNPCIWFYPTQLFDQELKRAERLKDKLPVVVKQNIKTTGDGSSWPEKLSAENYSNLQRNLGKNEIFNKFIRDHHYTEVWTNELFTIFIPGK